MPRLAGCAIELGHVEVSSEGRLCKVNPSSPQRIFMQSDMQLLMMVGRVDASPTARSSGVENEP
jgi:hypothetical protein